MFSVLGDFAIAGWNKPDVNLCSYNNLQEV